MTSQFVDQVALIKDEVNLAPVWIAGASVLFGITRIALAGIVPSKVVAQGAGSTWKWKNIANSLLHSVITGLGAIVSFYRHPNMADDVVSSYSRFAHILTSFSIGYFIFDFFDMLLNHRKRSSYELLIHHVFVVSCFGLAAFSRYYLGYAMVSLLVEVNSAFLHWRQLLLLQGTPKTNSLYRKVSVANLATFVVFRIVTFGWLTRWQVLNGHTIPTPVYVLGCVSLAAITVMNIILFYRLLRADYHSLRKEEKIHTN